MTDCKINFSQGGAEISFSAETRKFGFLKSEIAANASQWSISKGASAALALSELDRIAEDFPDSIRHTETAIFISHDSLARLSANTLRVLSLPVNPPFDFELAMMGNLGSPEFFLKSSWSSNQQAVSSIKKGAVLETSQGDYIIPEPIYSALNLMADFDHDPKQNVEARTAYTANVIKLFNRLDEQFSDTDYIDSAFQANLDEVLKNFRVRSASSLSLSINRKADGISIFPVLFSGSEIIDGAEISEDESILSKNEKDIFEHDSKRSFFSFDHFKTTYLLGTGDYILIDDNLAPALKHIHNLKKCDEHEREMFAKNPIKILTEFYRNELTGSALFQEMDVAGQEEQIEHLVGKIYVETKEYSDRVLGLGLWVPPIIPYIEQPVNPWEPETFGLKIGDEFVPLAIEDINPLKQKIIKAIEIGEDVVNWKGKMLPASADTVGTLDYIGGIVEPQKPADTAKSGNRKPDGQEVLLVKENFDDLTYHHQLASRSLNVGRRLPKSIQTTLKPHQVEAFDWQINAYNDGLPGVLNADDQGLGKTLQSISFLAWLQEHMKNGPDQDMKPILIIAPTSLLKNWENEVEVHMTSVGLGARFDAYGAGVAKLFTQSMDEGGFDFEAGGTKNLCWVLTTYTTFTNYHTEFAKIKFAAVVFDEIQYLKNPKSLRYHAAQTINADMLIGLTGTPIENSIVDLWAITDTLVPGYLGSLKQYSEKYANATVEGYKDLNNLIFKASGTDNDTGAQKAPIGIRRMKSEAASDLPAKNYRLYPIEMPLIQAAAYHSIFLNLEAEGAGRALKILHHLRSVSLYPEKLELVEQQDDGLEALTSKSARIFQIIKIIDDIWHKKEKVLLFLETRQLQYFLQRLLAQKYNLDRINIINGDTSAKRRDEFVQEFQAGLNQDPTFNIIILGPKAAGVGLTLTAATHVIHLSRWWNPAVEEQCNDRIYRIGQKQDVTIHIPIAVHPDFTEKSFDCILNNIMTRKRALFQDVLMPPVDADGGVQELVSELTGESDFEIDHIDKMSWLEFEDWIAEKARTSKQWTAHVTPRTGDGGCDIMLEHRERSQKVIVQVKHTDNISTNMPKDALNEVLEARKRFNEPKSKLVVITNAKNFNQPAIDMSGEHEIILVSRKNLALWPTHII